jgi:hypothetical protein
MHRQHISLVALTVQVPTTAEMVTQVRQGQSTVFQVAYAWLLARLGATRHPLLLRSGWLREQRCHRPIISGPALRRAYNKVPSLLRCLCAAENLEVMPGEEFRVALQEAHACGARICFGDRPVQACCLSLRLPAHLPSPCNLLSRGVKHHYGIPGWYASVHSEMGEAP